MSIEMRLIERVADSPNKDLPTVEVAQAALRVINDLQSALSEARAEVERLKRERDDLARREKASLSAAQCFDGSLPSTERFEGVIRQALVAQDQRLGAAERDCRDARAERDELRAEVERLRGVLERARTRLRPSGPPPAPTPPHGDRCACCYHVRMERGRAEDVLAMLRAALTPKGGEREADPSKCRSCPHPPHLGLCTKRNGGTAYACGCSAQTPGPRASPTGGEE